MVLLDLTSFCALSSATVKSMQLLWLNIKLMSSGTVSMKDLSGPIGIVQVASHQLNTSITAFVQLMAFISITLGIMNLLPIPVLDGGHILFLFIEGLLKKPVPEKVYVAFNNVFAICLIAFMVIILFNDVRFWSERTDLLENLSK